MSKNILVFSDGTGQVGGLTPDETRSNIYKMYRATRCGPDSNIKANEQLSFYDPGLGSLSLHGGFFSRAWRRIHNVVSKATGLGITTNIIDCYAWLIRIYEPGDRIFHDIIQLGCMAHARRPFAELVKLAKTTRKSHQAVAFFQKLYAIEKQAKAEKLSPEQRYFLRLSKAVPILNDMNNPCVMPFPNPN